MPQPYLVGDERAMADYLANSQSNPVQVTAVKGLQTSITAALAAITNTETLVVSAPLVPGVTLQPGTKIRITIEGTSTSTVANVTTFTVRAGVLGTIADASVVAFATAVAGTTGTAIPFKAVIELTVRTLGSAGTAAGSLTITANAATAIGGAVTTVVAGTSATLATTTATFLDVTLNNAAATTAETVQDATIEIFS